MKDIGRMINRMEKGVFLWKEEVTLGIGWRTRRKEKESICGEMGMCTRGNGRRVGEMEQVLISGRMATSIRESGKMTEGMDKVANSLIRSQIMGQWRSLYWRMEI